MEQIPVTSRRTTVHFTGERSGTTGVTWGQQDIWRLYHQSGARRSHFNHGRVYAVPADVDLTHVCAAIRILVERYEALRTTVQGGPDGELRQVLSATGELAVEIVGAPDRAAADAATESVRMRYLGSGFDDDEWPLRSAVICTGEAPTYVVLMASHLAVDRAGLDVLSRTFLRLLAGAEPEPAGRQPFDLAADEASPRGRRTAHRAVEYWRRALLATPPLRFPPPAGGRPGWPSADLDSAAAALAAGLTARRLRVSPPAVVLSAVSAVLSRYTGSSRVALQLIAANRVSAELREMVATVVQRAYFSVDCAEATFDEVVRRGWAALALAHRHGRYPPSELDAMLNEVARQRAAGSELHCFVNNFADFRASREDMAAGADLDAALAGTRFRAGVSWSSPRAFSLEIRDRPGALRFSLIGDPRILDADGVRAVLCGLEALLVAGARDDVAVPDVPALQGHGPHRE